MRTWLRPLILLNLVTLTNHALADSDPNIGVLTGLPGRTGGNTVIASGGGETTIQSLNADQVLNSIATQHKDVYEQNLSLINNYVQRLANDLKQLQGVHLSGDPSAMGSDKGLFTLATRGSLIPVRDYLTAKQNYLNMKALVQLDMDSIIGTAKALSQQNTNMVADLGVKNLTAQIPAPVKDLLLQEVVTPAQQQLAFIDAQISALVFRVDNNGKPEQITGLNFDASQVAMSTQEKTELQNKVRLLTSEISRAQQLPLIQYNTAIKKEFNDIMRTAKTMGYRLTDSDFTTSVNEKIDKIFFTRSYMRLRFNSPMGALLINYTVKSFYKDFFETGFAIPWVSEVPFSYGNKDSVLYEMKAAFKKAAAASLDFETWKQQEGIAWKGISGISTVLNFVTGHSNEQRFKAAVLALLIADYEEESAVTQMVGGRQILVEKFISRYFTVEDKKTYYKKMRDELSQSISQILSGGMAPTATSAGPVTAQNAAAMLSSGTSAVGSADALGMIRDIVLSMNNFLMTMEEARKSQQLLYVMTQSDSTQIEQKRFGEALDMIGE